MKQIFTLLFTSLFSLSLLAYDGSRLSISTVANLNLKVEVDGRKYNMNNNSLIIRDLSTGYHTVKIYRDKNKKGLFGNKQEQVYNSSVYIKDGHHLDITINRFGKALVDERRIDRNDEWYTDDDDNYYDGNNNYGRERDNIFGRNMSSADFAAAKETLRREFFENTRVTLAKQIIDRNNFSSAQVKEMLQLFSFESNRLELAKYTYSRTTDKNNYYIINDVFSYSSSKDELARFIRNK